MHLKQTFIPCCQKSSATISCSSRVHSSPKLVVPQVLMTILKYTMHLMLTIATWLSEKVCYIMLREN